jgi:hypothetical protein
MMLVALLRPSRNVDSGRNFASLAASDREDPRLVRPAKSPSGFCDIEALCAARIA